MYRAFSKSHGFRFVRGPDSIVWNDDDLPEHLLIHADIRCGGWMHLLGCDSFGMWMMSPPCPPWSRATSALGLMKDDGRLTVDAVGLCNLVRPKAFLFENVAAMKP